MERKGMRKTVVRCQEEDCNFRAEDRDSERAWRRAEIHREETGHDLSGQVVEVFTFRRPRRRRSPDVEWQ